MRSIQVLALCVLCVALISIVIYSLVRVDQRYIASYSVERMELLKSELVFDLVCSEKPDPLKYLMALDEWGYLDKRERYGADGIGCFPFAKDFAIEGHKFLMICGYDNSELWRSLNLTYFERLPFGTNPPDHLSLITQSDVLGIHRWEKEKIKFGYPDDPPHLPVEKSWLIDATDLNLPFGTKLNAIECSRYE